MLEEGPSEEVTAEAAMEGPEGLEWNGKGEREEAGGKPARRPWGRSEGLSEGCWEPRSV